MIRELTVLRILAGLRRHEPELSGPDGAIAAQTALARRVASLRGWRIRSYAVDAGIVLATEASASP